jgi:hypothetical protein
MEVLMGRYISGDFSYKFVFADQSSSFGEVLEKLAEGTDNSVTRYISNEGEIVRLYLSDPKTLAEKINEFTKEYEPLTPEQEELWSRFKLKMGDEYWDKYMMKQFSEELDLENRGDGDSLEFEVEY